MGGNGSSLQAGQQSVLRIIHDDRERCGEWAIEHLDYVTTWGTEYECLGLERDGELVAVVVYNFYTGNDIAMHIASDGSRRWLCKSFLHAGFHYPFVKLGVRRVTGYVPANNEIALKFDTHLGFRYEGTLRDALPDCDVHILGMLRRECRWLGES
jgi:RimJ/RimL family protein N-acetyltransferase